MRRKSRSTQSHAIRHYSGGVLGRDISQQPDLVLDGKADIAFVVPGYTPARFPDNAVVELPGLFHDTREATLVYIRLIAFSLASKPVEVSRADR